MKNWQGFAQIFVKSEQKKGSDCFSQMKIATKISLTKEKRYGISKDNSWSLSKEIDCNMVDNASTLFVTTASMIESCISSFVRTQNEIKSENCQIP